jgi:hypothetical protein
VSDVHYVPVIEYRVAAATRITTVSREEREVALYSYIIRGDRGIDTPIIGPIHDCAHSSARDPYRRCALVSRWDG